MNPGVGARNVSAKMTPFLGWFSIGLGAAEVIAPRWLSKRLGMGRVSASALRLSGVRELASGVAVLMPQTRSVGLWSRLAGDMLDLGALSRTSRRSDSDGNKLGAVTAAVLGVSALDLFCAVEERSRSAQPITAKESMAIDRSPEELYSYWRDPKNMPRIMSFLESVEVIDERRSHWRAKLSGKQTIEWDSEITADRPNEFLAWRSIEGSEIRHAGSVGFKRLPSDHGTAVTVQLEIAPSAFQFGGAVGSLLGPLAEHKVRRDLRRFKQLMEVGEITTTEGQPAGRAHGETRLDAAAQM